MSAVSPSSGANTSGNPAPTPPPRGFIERNLGTLLTFAGAALTAYVSFSGGLFKANEPPRSAGRAGREGQKGVDGMIGQAGPSGSAGTITLKIHDAISSKTGMLSYP